MASLLIPLASSSWPLCNYPDCLCSRRRCFDPLIAAVKVSSIDFIPASVPVYILYVGGGCDLSLCWCGASHHFTANQKKCGGRSEQNHCCLTRRTSRPFPGGWVRTLSRACALHAFRLLSGLFLYIINCQGKGAGKEMKLKEGEMGPEIHNYRYGSTRRIEKFYGVVSLRKKQFKHIC